MTNVTELCSGNDTLGLSHNASGYRSRALSSREAFFMNLSISSHHFDITPAIEKHLKQKMRRIDRHFDHTMSVEVILSVEKHEQKAEAKMHVNGKDLFCESKQIDLYNAIDELTRKMDRTVLKEKALLTRHSTESIRHLQMAVGPV
ncbi:MAG: ribosome hibernation-promoting factor, HPF/YfiA family [Burkholderiales bacterium]